MIQALLRKPGAFARYRHREEMFPDATYRAAQDQLVRDHGQRPGELEYLPLLKLTAELGLSAVSGWLSQLGWAKPLRRGARRACAATCVRPRW